jgi:hypothetical protein
MLEMSS